MNVEPTPPLTYPREGGSPAWELPLENVGPSPFFPPVCLKTHWDPTAILRHTLPAGYVPQPLDPRPWTRICMSYTTAGGEEPAPASGATVLPSGGQFAPPDRYQAAIDNESRLRRLDRPLGTCEGNQWEPSLRSDMYDARQLVPRNTAPSNPAMIQEVAYPKALLRSGPYECRAIAQAADCARSSCDINTAPLFNNATKQDRYKLMGKPARPSAPREELRPSNLRPDLTFDAGRPNFVDGSYERQSADQRDALRGARTPEQVRQQVAAGYSK